MDSFTCDKLRGPCRELGHVISGKRGQSDCGRGLGIPGRGVQVFSVPATSVHTTFLPIKLNTQWREVCWTHALALLGVNVMLFHAYG